LGLAVETMAIPNSNLGWRRMGLEFVVIKVKPRVLNLKFYKFSPIFGDELTIIREVKVI
jgi:hypothetical protein